MMNGIGAAILLTLAAAQTSAQGRAELGPEPGWERFEQLAREAVASQRAEAEFGFSHRYTPGYFTAGDGTRHYGYWTCGTVRGRDAGGRKLGWSNFVVVVRDDRVVYGQVGRPGPDDPTLLTCAEAVRSGVLAARPEFRNPRFGSFEPRAAQAQAGHWRFGINYSAHPRGALITSVHWQSPAGRMRLTPGLIITHLNGRPLAGYRVDDLVRAIDAAPSPSNLTFYRPADQRTFNLSVPKAEFRGGRFVY